MIPSIFISNKSSNQKSLIIQMVLIFFWPFPQSDHQHVRERPLMMSDFLGGGGFKMTLKYWTLEGKNRTSGGGGQK